jgi:hypothetical protein
MPPTEQSTPAAFSAFSSQSEIGFTIGCHLHGAMRGVKLLAVFDQFEQGGMTTLQIRRFEANLKKQSDPRIQSWVKSVNIS